jgi:hypothetical protein
MTRSIRLSIAPAKPLTCGDGSGNFCPMLRTTHFGQRWHCRIFRNDPNERQPHELKTSTGNGITGWLAPLA